jgi:hypothetical protein
VTQIGDGVAIGVVFAVEPDKEQPQLGHLIVRIFERSSEEAIAGVEVSISGASSATATTDASGQVKFDGIPAGNCSVSLSQAEFEMAPAGGKTSVGSGATKTLEWGIRRVLTTVVVKRIHIQGLAKAAVGDKSQLECGRWWTEVDAAESYGW